MQYWQYQTLGKNYAFISGEIMIVVHSYDRMNTRIQKVLLDRLLNEKENQGVKEFVPE